ncbi:DUF1801 domain-containing protein [Paracoccus kondratievae]
MTEPQDKPKLLSGGNPQIPKGYGEAPVRAYIDALPGWKHQVGEKLDQIVTRTVPGVKKAVKWNSPFYGVEEGVWFLSFHCMTKYIKVGFFAAQSWIRCRLSPRNSPTCAMSIFPKVRSTKSNSPIGCCRPAICRG